MRFHVHLTPRADACVERDASITISCDAADDAEAQAFALGLLEPLDCDVAEIDSDDGVLDFS